MNFGLFLTLNWNKFCYILRKAAKLHFLQCPQKSLKIPQHSHQQRHPLQNNSPLKKWKNCTFWWLFFKRKFLTFWKSNIWAKVYHLKNWGPGVIIVELTGYRSCYFISLNITQISLTANSNHTKTAVNSAMHLNEIYYQRNCQIHKYLALRLMKMTNMSKTWLADNKFSLWMKCVFRLMERRKCYFQISNSYCQKLFEKPTIFIMDLEEFYKVLIYQKYFWPTKIFVNRTTVSL